MKKLRRIKNKFKAWLDYHFTRRELKKGDIISFCIKVSNEFSKTEKCQSYTRSLLRERANEWESKYNVILHGQDFRIGFMDDDLLMNQQTWILEKYVYIKI